jgi:hypothetical protein
VPFYWIDNLISVLDRVLLTERVENISQFRWVSSEEAEQKQNLPCSQAPVAHAYNPSYSGSRDPEDHDLKPAQAK